MEERINHQGSVTRTSSRSNEYLIVLERLWRNPELPMDTRRATLGAMHQAFLRQGDYLIPQDEVKIIMNPEGLLEPDRELALYEKAHRWVFSEHRMRPQYVAIVLKVLTNHLQANHVALAQQYAKKLQKQASTN